MSRITRCAAAIIAFVALAPVAGAQYSQTVGEFNGPYGSYPYPSAPYTIGTFTGLTAGGSITSATISGTFGNTTVSNTAPSRIFLNSVLVAQCVDNDTCTISGTPTAWSYTFTPADFAALAGSSTANLTVVQDNDYVLRIGATTLNVNYGSTTTTPEPSSMALLGTGLVGLVPMVRRRRK